ncbi:MAG: ATP-binding protein [Planctomycetaceae bacterium]
MANILFLDTSDVERQRFARLVASRDDWQAIGVSRLTEAIERCQLHPVDLLVTELFLDDTATSTSESLALLEANAVQSSPRPSDPCRILSRLRDEVPTIPVIAVSDRADEQAVAAAFRAGAVDFLPKQFLDTQLIDAIDRALDIAETTRRKTRQAKLIKNWTVRETKRLRLTSDRKQMPLLAQQLVRWGIDANVLTEADDYRVGVALEEALVNAVVHGNLEVSSKLRELDDDAYEKLIALREQMAPYCDRSVRVGFTRTRNEVRYTIADEGPGFDVSKLPDPTSEEALLKPSGRGILMMRAFMDEVSFNEKGNQVTLAKRRLRTERVQPVHQPQLQES